MACDAHSRKSICTIHPELTPIVVPEMILLEKRGYIKSTEISPHELGFTPTCQAQELASGHITYCWCAHGL
jgi:hypothetical protein